MKGLLLSEPFLQMFGSHYTQLQGAIKTDAVGDPKILHPIGAPSLCDNSVSPSI